MQRDLDAYMKRYRQQIDAVLDRILPPADTRPTVLHQAMRHAVLNGGKRLRPLLCLAAAEAVGAPADCAYAAGAAVELLHAYTLVHDDLPCMDDDDERRGQPTCHVKYGEANAVLAGDALQALAFATAADAAPPARCDAAWLVRELAQAAGSFGVVGGQVEDIAAESGATDMAQIAYIHQHKTADLFCAALRMGALAGGANPQQVKALAQYGRLLGLAFQLTDDLLDYTPDAAASQTDLNCVYTYGIESTRQKAQDAITMAKASLCEIPADRTFPLLAIADKIATRKR